jgi:hypothetical protein
MAMCAHVLAIDKDAKIKFFFESGHARGPYANALLSAQFAAATHPIIKKAYVSHQFKTKADSRLLHAADLLVWPT